MTHLSAHYVFHPVGQGLFASGALFGHTNPDRHLLDANFRWVYDCGTSSSQQLVIREIDRLYNAARNGAPKPRLDLVAISHFDSDHISGFVALLEKFQVQNLLLPYLPLWQRIAIAFDQSAQNSPEAIRFFLDPIAFINRIEGAEIKKIILARSSEQSSSDNNPNEIPSEDTDSPWGLMFEATDLNEQERDELNVSNQSPSGIPLFLLRPGSAMRVARQWEFVPYNDSFTFPAPSQVFLDAVESARGKLLQAAKEDDRVVALKELKDKYDNEFGKTAKARNGISLHLYGGPIGRTQTIASCHCCSQTYFHSCCHHWCGDDECWFPCDFRHQKDQPLGILYTGDAYLNTSNKLVHLMNFLHMPSSRNLLCLQVMHHGAKGNWHKGVATKLAPMISVFSSNPNDGRYRHPHIPVWKDFEKFGRTQVNESCGMAVCACYR